ncbi:MAG: sulfite exporter TauE/SafE family protein [Humidesulfovibrio sp.]|uniref:sulfite exporter TauE/SafE family protein n=1 Tax=Humidesulfovibrio sp. TaxID=2910988 RepID=UPI0027FC2BAB|nr:sulfite exporter TauE/SafE family protein [Humidesulfovibrio sp.]MDQ7835023.1 sulfite exporter TauE/SafE family protein [Humidesulfovibrio sp.]
MNRRSLIACAIAALSLCLWLGVAVAQQAPAAPAADAAKAVEAAAGNAAKAVEGAAKAVEGEPMSKLAAALEKAPRGTEKGMIDESKPAGFLGIPGAPTVNPILAFAWAVWVGWIFSTVGAFGGVMAGVGHMSVFGFGSYAGGLKKTAPDLGKIVTDSIKASNQFLVGTSAAISSFNYLKMGRLVLPLAISLGLGSLIGAYGAAALSAGKLDFKSYQGYFGLFVLVLGCYLLYETTPGAQTKKKTAKEAAKAFEDAVKKLKSGEAVDESKLGLHIQKFNMSTCEFVFYGVPFKFNPLIPFLGGICISAVAAFLGVGGGFLLVPFLTSVTQLPMYLAAGTSALAVLVSMVTSIITLMTKGTPIEWTLIGTELVGITVGSIVGPMTSKYLSDKLMKRIFIALSFYIGFGYLLAGFVGYKIPGV